MTTSDGLRVAVDVTPRLFSDALARALTHHHVEVVPLLEMNRTHTDDRVDVVDTSESEGSHLPADILIVRVSPGAGSSAVETAPANAANARVRTLDDLVAVIRRFAGSMGLTAT